MRSTCGFTRPQGSSSTQPLCLHTGQPIAAADQALDIEFEAGLDERKESRAQPHRHVALEDRGEQRLHEVDQVARPTRRGRSSCLRADRRCVRATRPRSRCERRGRARSCAAAARASPCRAPARATCACAGDGRPPARTCPACRAPDDRPGCSARRSCDIRFRPRARRAR